MSKERLGMVSDIETGRNIDLEWNPRKISASEIKDSDLRIIKTLGGTYFNLPPFHDEPKLFHVVALLPGWAEKKGLERASGTAWSYTRAVRKALGETIERLSALTPQGFEHRMATFGELDDLALDPEDYHMFTCPKVPSRDHRISWTEGFQLSEVGERNALVPSQLVFLPYERLDGEPVWFQITSNGLAAGLTIEHAIWNGLMELIERDSLFAFWFRDEPIIKVDSPSHDCSAKTLLEETYRYRLESSFYLLPAQIPECYSMMCVLQDSTENGPFRTIGFKTAVSFDDAVLGSLEEAHQLRPLLRDLKGDSGGPPTVLRTIEDRARWLLTDEAQGLLADKLSMAVLAAGSFAGDDVGADVGQDVRLGDLVASMSRRNHQMWVVPLQKVVDGYITVRVIIPTFQAPFFDEKLVSVLRVNAPKDKPLSRHPLL